MTRIAAVQRCIDKLLSNAPDEAERLHGFAHLHGVSQACALLAQRRGLDAELAATAGLLHDMAFYATLYSADHAARSAAMARPFLEQTGVFSTQEIDAVCAAIACHSDKAGRHAPLAEALIDADVLQHAFSDPTAPPPPHELPRLTALRKELGIPVT